MNLMDKFIDPKTIAGGLILALLLWLAKVLWERFRLRRDSKAIEEWLKTNTRDEPGESHRNVSEIACHLGLSEDRVNQAVARSHAILRSDEQVDQISIWRQEPQSIYEKRGL